MPQSRSAIIRDFVISNKENHFMIDGGGGSMILHQLKSAGLDWKEMRDIFRYP